MAFVRRRATPRNSASADHFRPGARAPQASSETQACARVCLQASFVRSRQPSFGKYLKSHNLHIQPYGDFDLVQNVTVSSFYFTDVCGSDPDELIRKITSFFTNSLSIK